MIRVLLLKCLWLVSHYLHPMIQVAYPTTRISTILYYYARDFRLKSKIRHDICFASIWPAVVENKLYTLLFCSSLQSTMPQRKESVEEFVFENSQSSSDDPRCFCYSQYHCPRTDDSTRSLELALINHYKGLSLAGALTFHALNLPVSLSRPRTQTPRKTTQVRSSRRNQVVRRSKPAFLPPVLSQFLDDGNNKIATIAEGVANCMKKLYESQSFLRIFVKILTPNFNRTERLCTTFSSWSTRHQRTELEPYGKGSTVWTRNTT